MKISSLIQPVSSAMLAVVLVSSPVFASNELETDRAVLTRANGERLVVRNRFDQPKHGDLYVAAFVENMLLFFSRDKGLTQAPEAFRDNETYQGSETLLDFDSQTLPDGRYQIYQVVVNSGGNLMNPADWVGGAAGLSMLNLAVGLPPVVSNDLDNDGFADDDANRDGFHDDDMDRDGFHDDDTNRDGFHDDDNNSDGFHDDDLNHDGFHDDDLNRDGFHDDDLNYDGFHDDDANRDGFHDDDANHDGFHDDDMNRDGFHDDDDNSDGFHDDDMDHDGFHDNEMDDDDDMPTSGTSSPTDTGSTNNTPPTNTASAANGQSLYAQNCSACHGSDPAAGRNNILAARSASATRSAISANRGGMGSLSFLNDVQLSDITAYVSQF